MTARDLSGLRILIVGASSGMGRQVALRMAEQGATVALTARRTELLDELAYEITSRGGQCTTHPADATDPAAAVAVVEEIIAGGGIDVALLNAGGAPAVDLHSVDAATVTGYMRSNYDVAVNYLVPLTTYMTGRGKGTIAHTNSLAGWYGIPLQGPYSAAKAALRVLFDSYRIEYANSGIRFISIYPGFVRTEATIGDGMPAPGELSEEVAADHIVKALLRNNDSYSFPRSTTTAVHAGRLLPTKLRHAVLRRMD